MQLIATLIYWVVVALWLGVLATVLVYFKRNPRIFGTTRLLLLVVALDTCRNIVENVYFGMFFGSQYGFFPAEIGRILGNPSLLIIPKLVNVAAGCIVIGVLLMRWLPKAMRERDRSELLAADLKLLATTDGLTSLVNRRHFDVLARAEWLRFQRYGRPLSLIVIDVDNFKSINDRFGHDAGDVVLKAIASNCDEAKRETDVAARMGGDEFALLLPETSEAAAEVVAERLRQQIYTYSRVFPGDDSDVSVSVGVAGATLGMSSFDRLLKRADEAMYEAKRAGRNQVFRAPRQFSESYQTAAE
jgi:diguanylate cyclase (GGDEF)-like protein